MTLFAKFSAGFLLVAGIITIIFAVIDRSFTPLVLGAVLTGLGHNIFLQIKQNKLLSDLCFSLNFLAITDEKQLLEGENDEANHSNLPIAEQPSPSLRGHA